MLLTYIPPKSNISAYVPVWEKKKTGLDYV